jgi:hypothetical protein
LRQRDHRRQQAVQPVLCFGINQFAPRARGCALRAPEKTDLRVLPTGAQYRDASKAIRESAAGVVSAPPFSRGLWASTERKCPFLPGCFYFNLTYESKHYLAQHIDTAGPQSSSWLFLLPSN